jgi:L-aminopeptidase/D-esterase-like protein
MLTNDSVDCKPVIPEEGPVLEFDFPGLRIGVAEYAEGPTGCTVFLFDRLARTAVDLRGGSIGSLGNKELNHAICLAGGSSYGLQASTGVAAELFAQRGHSREFEEIAAVSGSIIYDFRARDNAVIPDVALGRAAVRAAVAGRFPLGARGAGCSAVCGRGPEQKGRQHSGQGGAFRQVGPTRIAAFSVVNSLGGICDRNGQVVWGQLNPETGERYGYAEELARLRGSGGEARPIADAGGNTTLTLLVVNQKLERKSLVQLARQVHTSMARAIQPFHTILDGDVFYAVTTDEVENPALDEIALGVECAEAVWDAVLSIPGAVGGGDRVVTPSW